MSKEEKNGRKENKRTLESKRLKQKNQKKYKIIKNKNLKLKIIIRK